MGQSHLHCDLQILIHFVFLSWTVCQLSPQMWSVKAKQYEFESLYMKAGLVLNFIATYMCSTLYTVKWFENADYTKEESYF